MKQRRNEEKQELTTILNLEGQRKEAILRAQGELKEAGNSRNWVSGRNGTTAKAVPKAKKAMERDPDFSPPSNLISDPCLLLVKSSQKSPL